MYTVVRCFSINDYTVLILNKLPDQVMHGIEIYGERWEAGIAYDIENAVYIRGEHDFTGQEIGIY